MVRLGDVCDILNGYAFKSEEYSDSGFRIIRISNVQKGYVEDTTPVFYPEDNPIVNKYELFENDLLLSLTGNVGRVALLEKEFLPAALNQRVACLRPKKGTAVRTKYLFHILNSDAFEKACILSSKGLAQKNMSTEWLKDYLIPLPSLEKQDEISETLNKVDELISLRKKQLQKLDDIVKARFIEMFGDVEKNSKHWNTVQLSQLCDLQNGYAFKSDDYLPKSNVINCRMSNIRPDGGFDAEYNPKYLPDEYWMKYQAYQLHDGDVIIAMTDMASDPKILGVPTIVKTKGKRFLLNQRVGKLIFLDDGRMNRVYLMYYLGQAFIRKNLAKLAGGSTQINVGKPEILSIKVQEPPAELQELFSNEYERIISFKQTVKQGLDKLEQMKQALMQKYFG